MMNDLRIAVVGIGATGTVLAAALLNQDPEVVLVDPKPGLEKEAKNKGLIVSGVVAYKSPVRHFFTRISDLKELRPNLVFISTKTFHLEKNLEELKDVVEPGAKLISTHNGLGTEDLIARMFDVGTAFRMSLNFGASLAGAGQVETAFFNRPNHLGALTEGNRELGLQMAERLTAAGLDTEYTDDIKLYVWKKMVLKCTMASICAVTDKTIKGALEFPPTREIAGKCFDEAMAVAGALGFDLGEEYLEQGIGYLQKVGVHRDSMCYDIANKSPTEIDFLGGKVVEYAEEKGISVPFYTAMTNLVKALEDEYLPN
jgi:2-dehydropantoate 2-reductase